MEKLHPAWSSASLIAESTESSFSTPLAFFLLLRFLELKIMKLLILTLLLKITHLFAIIHKNNVLEKNYNNKLIQI